MNPVPVQVAASSVVVLGRPWVGVTGEDLCIAQRDAGVQCVSDCSVSQGVGADVSRDAGSLRHSGDHSVDVAPVDGVAGERAED